LIEVAETLLANSGRERTSAFCYAVGLTQHTTGVQIIRAVTILQCLLGNMGRPGGGILALRGHCSIQGNTDIATLYNMLPGYLTQPSALKPHNSLEEYLEVEGAPTGWWHNFPTYAISLLKAWYGDHATRENDFGYDWLPKIMGDHSQLPMTLAMKDGTIRGLFLMGQNVVVGGQNSRLIREGLANLEWLVVRETAENESGSFWYRSSAGTNADDLTPERIGTEVFLLPAALAGEKGGTFTNTQRLVQWHDKVVDAPADCRSDLWFVYHLGRLLKEMYAESTEAKDAPIQNLLWDYPLTDERQEPSPEAVLKEINGYTWPERNQLSDMKELRPDGSTACGAWIYTGVFPRNDHNQTCSRVPDEPGGPGTHLGWAYAWPANRRILYNRASADAQGRPWSEEKKYVWWDEDEGTWTGYDEADFPEEKAPGYEPDFSEPKEGMDAIRGDAPFIMMADGRANLFAMTGLKDGPLPAHYEPAESPVRNRFYSQQENPATKKWERDDNPYHGAGDERYPYIVTTFRLTEHHTAGTPTRSVHTTAELQPEGFAEISPRLAHEKSIENLDWIVISTARGEIETRALITERIPTLNSNGKAIEQIGLPWHFGWEGYATGDIANVLAAIVGEPNTTIHEAKAFTANMRKGRIERARGAEGADNGANRGEAPS
jgi:formate dehydrogenase major subunit